jgi:SOS response regulatory protein OraA/RecX
VNELFNRMRPGEFIGLIAVAGGLVVGAISIIVTQWRRVRLAEQEAALKQQMLEKGLAPAEIEQVLTASRESDQPRGLQLTGSEAGQKAALVNLLAVHGYEGEDIERILKAFGSGAPPGPDDQSRNTTGRAAALEILVKNEMSREDIEKVLSAFDSQPQPAARG